MQQSSRHRQRLTVLAIMFLAAGFLSNGTPASAQFTDEVWIEPNWFDRGAATCDPVTEGCCTYRLSPFREDWLDTVLHPETWPTVHGRTDVFSMLIGILAVPCSAGGESFERLTDSDLTDLIDTLANPSHPLRVNFDVGGVRVGHGGDFCGDTAGETLATSNFALLNRWYAQGGQIDHFSLDHPVRWTQVEQAVACDPATDPTCCPVEDHLTWQEAAEEVGDYFVTLKGLVETAHPGVTFQPQIGLWESSGGYHFQALDGTLYEPIWSPTTEVIQLDDVVLAVDAALESRGFDLDAFLIDFDPDAVESLGTPQDWSFDRVIDIEKLMRSMGYQVGISNHLGPCANGVPSSPSCSVIDPALVDDQWAHDTFLRYAGDYVAAGGSPDLLQAYAWHQYPTVTGPEDLENSYMNIVKDVLTEVYPPVVDVPYFEDSFEGASLGAPWSADSSWSIVAGVVLEQSDSAPQSTRIARLDGEAFGNVDVEYSVRLLAGSGWAGIHLRQSDAGVSPWVSGYLVRLSADGQVTLTRPGVSLASAATGVDPTSQWARIRVHLRGDRIRVEVGGVELIDVTDDTYASGRLSLVTLDQAARYDDVAITQLRLGSIAFADDFDDQDTVGWQLDGGSWGASTGQLVQTSSQGLGLASIAGSTFDALRASARVKLDSATGWAGFQLRKDAPATAPWSAGGGYLVQISDGGWVRLYKNGAGTLEQVQTSLDFSAAFADLEVTLVDHRVVVAVNGIELINFWDDTFELGYFSLATLNQKADFDDFVLESLD